MSEMLLTRRMRIVAGLAIAFILAISGGMLRQAPHDSTGNPIFTTLIFFLPLIGLVFSLWVSMELSEHTLLHSLLRANGSRISVGLARLRTLFKLLSIGAVAAVLLGLSTRIRSSAPVGYDFAWSDILLALQFSATSIVANIWIALLAKRISTTLLCSLVAHVAPFLVSLLQDLRHLPSVLDLMLSALPGVSLMDSTGVDRAAVLSFVWIGLLAWGLSRTWMKTEIA